MKTLHGFRIFKHQQLLGAENRVGVVVTASNVHAQFERHVQAEIIACFQGFYPAQIMDAVARLLNQLLDFLQPHLGGVEALQCDTGMKSAGFDGKNKGFQQRQIFIVVGTVDENVLFEAAHCEWEVMRWVELLLG